uniref:Putative ovule protein n=1 Tax=Solanum chacoense TaxID=4108 RepID=A0A0V0GGL4_SOLCH
MVAAICSTQPVPLTCRKLTSSSDTMHDNSSLISLGTTLAAQCLFICSANFNFLVFYSDLFIWKIKNANIVKQSLAKRVHTLHHKATSFSVSHKIHF